MNLKVTYPGGRLRSDRRERALFTKTESKFHLQELLETSACIVTIYTPFYTIFLWFYNSCYLSQLIRTTLITSETSGHAYPVANIKSSILTPARIFILQI